jgi:GT2 family glycosyltransferase
MTHRIAVSIINYRTGELTLGCLGSVLADMDGIDGRVVVVDNASGDGSADLIAGWIEAHPRAPVTLVRSETNTGFSGGHNQGIAAVRADLYLLLNSDAVVRPGFFEALLAEAERAPQAGIFAPRIAAEDGTPQTSTFRFASPASEFIRGANTGWITRALKRWEVSMGPHPDPAKIGWASFACIALRREMIEAIGPMDEGYVLYFEDAEYCLRAVRAGWRIAWVPDAVAVHFRGGSGPVKALARARKRLPPYYYASRTRFLYQAHGRAGLLAANAAWVAGRGLTQVRRLFGKDIYPSAEAERRDIWINAGTPLGPRRAPGESPAE